MSDGIRAFLAECRLFDSLDGAALDQAAAGAETVRLDRGQVLFSKGDESDSVYVLLEGRIKLSAVSEEGKEAQLTTLLPGDVFGELAAIDGEPRSADATAMEACVLYRLRQPVFMSLVETHSGFATNLLKDIVQKLRLTDEIIEDFVFLNLEARLAKLLLEISRRSGETVLAVSQFELAERLCVTREVVNRRLQGLRDVGAIDVKPRKIIINDISELKRVIQPDYED